MEIRAENIEILFQNVIFTYSTFYKRKSGSRVEREDLKFMSPGGNKKFGDRGPGAAKKSWKLNTHRISNGSSSKAEG